MKKKKVQQSLLALACAFALLSTGLSANAMEAAAEEDATFMSARLTGSCGCVMEIESMSKRNCVKDNDMTHTAEYYVSYVCSHGRKSQIEYIKEPHAYTEPYSNDLGHSGTYHLYRVYCRCGASSIKSIACYASPDATRGHAVP